MRILVIEVYAEAVPEKVDVDSLLPHIEDILSSITDGYVNVEVVDDRQDDSY